MTVRDIPQLGPLIALAAWIVTALVAPVALSAAPPQGEAGGEEIWTVGTAAQPCLDLRESPSYRAPIIGCLEIGSELRVSGAENGWSRVSSEGEGEGWVGTRLLNPPSEAATRGAASEPAVEPAPEPQPQPDTISEVARLTAERDALTQELGVAQARIASLEDELARSTLATDQDSSLRQDHLAELESLRVRLAIAEQRAIDLEAQAQAGASLSESVVSLTAERDRLAASLARAEARQFYLQSDLETTRAELMQLKGIPPKLVAPRQEPTVVTLPPVDTEPATIEETPGESLHVDEVLAAVRAWAQAWSSQRIDDYLDFYGPSFRPPDGLDRSSWEQLRRERIAAPRSIDVALDRVSPTVSAGNAIVLFQQTYVSDSFTDVVDKTLVLERIDGAWRIVEERVNR